MLRFVIGRSGAGKTRQCLEEIALTLRENPAVDCIYLVPEQASFHAEKSLLKSTPGGGVVQAQVLSFQRLAWRVLQETGGGTAPVLDEVGKSLILKHILDQQRQRFKVFAGVMGRPGFLTELVRALSEMKNYCVSPEKLVKCLSEQEEHFQGAFAEKLAEFIFIYQEFEAAIAQVYLDTDDNLQRLAHHLFQASFLKNARVWIDGFHGFTPQEYAVIRELLLYCGEVTVTVCLAPEHLRRKLPETHLFFQPWETYQNLRAMAEEIGCAPAELQILPEPAERRFGESCALAYLEKSFVRQLPPYQGAVSALQLKAAANCQEEVEEAAREILWLCREKGLRHQDIAVLLRDFANYENLISNIFRDYEIPFFLDMKKPVRHHPLPDLIQSVLEVIRGGWAYEPLFRCLKTDLLPLSRRETDLLENYCLAHGIKGKRWTDGKEWQYKKGLQFEEKSNSAESGREQKLLQRVNHARKKVVKCLLPLQQALQKAARGREYSAALFAFLEDIAVAEKLAYWTEKAEKAGALEEARLHVQVWKKILALLDSLVQVLGDREMTLQEFGQVMTGGLETLELGLIPPGLDQVLVGSVDRSRSPDLKAVLILGVNEGVFPARVQETGLFSDEERKLMQTSKVMLAPTTEKRLYAEQFLIYKALTTGSRYLTLSYAMADSEGKALTPSSLIRRLREKFPQVQDEQNLAQAKPEAKISAPVPTFSYLVTALREAVEGKPVYPLWWNVYNWYQERGEWQIPLRKVTTGLFYQQEAVPLPSSLVRKLYGDSLRGSISRLEKFRACPFAHFLSYGLKLQERAEYKVGAPDLGQFFHAGLERFYRYLRENSLAWGELTRSQMQEIVEHLVAALIPRLQNEVLLSTARYRYLTGKLKRILLRAVMVLGEHERRGTFHPVGMELSFGEKGQLPGLSLRLNDGTKIFLQGRIDRIDAAQAEQGCYLRIIDYKSGLASLSLPEIYYGLKLQLLTYLAVVLTHAQDVLKGQGQGDKAESSGEELRQALAENVIPGGVLYFPIKDPLVVAQGPLTEEEIKKKLFSELKMQGYLLQDADVVKMMDGEIAGYSELLPVALTRDGKFYQNSTGILTREKFALLCRYVEKVLGRIGGEIMAGRMAITPCQYQGKAACTYCAYQSVCRFDLLVPGYAYQVLKERSAEEIWQEIGREEDGHE